MSRFIIPLLIIVSLSACKKNTGEKPGNNNEKLLIASIITTDKNKATTGTYKYEYNAKNQMTLETFSTPTTTKIDSFKYFYDANGNLTSYTNNYYDSNSGFPALITGYTFRYKNNMPYSSTGIIPQSVDNSTFVYTVSGNKITIVGQIFYGNPVVGFKDSIIYDGQNVKTIYNIVNNASTGPETNSITYYYANHKDPFYYSGFKWLYITDPGFPPFGALPLAGQNLIEGFTEKLGGNTYTGINKFEYNSSGFPTKQIIYDVNGGIASNTYYSYITAK